MRLHWWTVRLCWISLRTSQCNLVHVHPVRFSVLIWGRVCSITDLWVKQGGLHWKTSLYCYLQLYDFSTLQCLLYLHFVYNYTYSLSLSLYWFIVSNPLCVSAYNRFKQSERELERFSLRGAINARWQCSDASMNYIRTAIEENIYIKTYTFTGISYNGLLH